MKLLFWTILIVAVMWWLLKKHLGAKNDLTAHFEEQNALNSIGNTALGANQIGTANYPLTTIGSSPLAGLFLDPLFPGNIFSQPNRVDLFPGTSSTSGYPDFRIPSGN